MGFFRGRPVAIKTLHDTTAAQISAVEAELQVHASLRDRRVVELIGANLVPPGCCIVMEMCQYSLFEKLHRRPEEMSRREAIGIAIQVAGGMAFLHSRRPSIVHRDLKSHNVLLDAHGDAKLCDFGLVLTREPTAATPNYMAPELFLAKSHSTPVDVFAFGVLLNELWAREVPWDGYSPLDIKGKVVGRASTNPSHDAADLREVIAQLVACDAVVAADLCGRLAFPGVGARRVTRRRQQVWITADGLARRARLARGALAKASMRQRLRECIVRLDGAR